MCVCVIRVCEKKKVDEKKQFLLSQISLKKKNRKWTLVYSLVYLSGPIMQHREDDTRCVQALCVCTVSERARDKQLIITDRGRNT